MSTNKSLVQSASSIGFATLCSRVLGFLRDVVIARLFGVYVYAQAFVVAFKIPNLFRDFVAEGAANSAFVPVFSKYSLTHSKEEFWELANIVLNLLLVALASITILGIIGSGVIVRLIAPGFISDAYKLEATIRLTRIIFPYILLIGLAAYATALLNSLKHFVLSAFAPCLLNISIIAFTLIFGESVKGLALGVLVGGLLQLAVQMPLLYKKGFRLELFRKFKHPEVSAISKLMLPRILSSGIYQLNNFVDSIFGSLTGIVGEGGVAGLYFFFRLIQFPIGIFSNALSQAILPTFSQQAVNNNRQELKDTLTFGLEATFFLLLPASIGLMVLGKPIISNLFEGGRFDAYSRELTANALFFYSLVLVAYGGTKILQSCFFALGDTLTPAKVAILALASNIILNSILMFPLKLGGLALATSISSLNTFLILFLILKRKVGGLGSRRIFISFLRILMASLCMAVVCYYSKALNLWLAILFGIGSYVIFCFFFRVKQIERLCKIF